MQRTLKIVRFDWWICSQQSAIGN